MLSRRTVLVGTLSLLLAGCSPSTNLIRPNAAGPVPDEAIVAFRLHGEGPGVLFGIGRGTWALNSAMRLEGTQRHVYVLGFEGRPTVYRVPAGTYSFIHFMSGDFVRVAEPLIDLPWNADSSIPVRPITLKPGEVVYLGDLKVHNIRFKQFVAGNEPGVTYSVTSNPDAARAEIDKEYPGRGAQMTTRLFEIAAGAVFTETTATPPH